MSGSLDLPSHRAQHSPRPDGRPHRADAEAVIAHLEESRARGAEFLLVPKSAFGLIEEDDASRRLPARSLLDDLLSTTARCVIFELVDRPVAPLVGRSFPKEHASQSPRIIDGALAGLDAGRTVAIPLTGDDLGAFSRPLTPTPRSEGASSSFRVRSRAGWPITRNSSERCATGIAS